VASSAPSSLLCTEASKHLEVQTLSQDNGGEDRGNTGTTRSLAGQTAPASIVKHQRTLVGLSCSSMC